MVCVLDLTFVLFFYYWSNYFHFDLCLLKKINFNLVEKVYLAIRWHYRTHNDHTQVTVMWPYWYYLLCCCLNMYF